MANVVAKTEILDEDFLRISSEFILSYAYDIINSYPVPNEEDYNTIEEYNEAFNNYLLLLVNYVKGIKLKVFTNVLDTYNNGLDLQRVIDRNTKKVNEISEKRILRSEKDNRNALIVLGICTLISPMMFPILAGLTTFRMLGNTVTKKRSISVNEEEKNKLKMYNDTLYKVYDLQDKLRTDYHHTKNDIEDLYRDVINGNINKNDREEFIKKLSSYVNPKSLGFVKYEEDYYGIRVPILDMMIGDILIENYTLEKGKELVKK